MDSVLVFFEGWFKKLSGLIAILLLIAGFFLGGYIGGYIGGHSGFSFGYALLGLLDAFIFDVFSFGFLGIIVEINEGIKSIVSFLNEKQGSAYSAKPEVSAYAAPNGNSYASSSMLDRLAATSGGGVVSQTWTCKKCGCSTNSISSATCKDCGEYK